MEERDVNIDCLKGILIVLVVIGHILSSINLRFTSYIYLFHMPSFFILSGMCYKKFDFKNIFLKSFSPFFTYMLLIYFLSKLFLYKTPLLQLILGGSELGGVFGVFWFIPCLFYSKILFGLIQNNKYLNTIFFFTIMYIVSIIALKYLTYNKFIFWNIDVAFICLYYYFIGNYIKNNKYNKHLFVISLIISVVISLFWYFDILKITFNMKNKSLFYNPILQIIFPLAITISLLNILNFINKKSIVKIIIAYIGKCSLVIMYLHVFIFNMLVKYTNISYLGQIFISIIIPMLMYSLFNKFKYTKRLLIG